MMRSRIDRRRFLAGSSLAGVAGMLGAGHAVLAAPPKRPTRPVPTQSVGRSRRRRPIELDEIKSEEFKKLIRSPFLVWGDPKFKDGARQKRTVLVLDEVTDVPVRPDDPRLLEKVIWTNGGNRVRKDPFYLVFKAKKGTDLAAATYRVASQHLGVFQLFLVRLPDVQDPTKQATSGLSALQRQRSRSRTKSPAISRSANSQYEYYSATFC